MKIAYISYEDSHNVKAWSGTISFIAKYLEKDNDVIRIDNLFSPIDYIFKGLSAIWRLFGKSADYKRNRFFVRMVCNRIQKKLDSLEYDLIFSAGSTYITFLKSDKPIVIWADATYLTIVNNHFQYNKLSTRQIKVGNQLEIDALNNCNKLIFSSEIPANSAISDYNIPASKVKIIPFGANVLHNNQESDIIKFNSEKNKNKIKLLFIGVYWNNKGGDILLDIFKEFQMMSTDYELEIVGSTPTKIPNIVGVTFHGYLDKSIPEENKKFINLFESSHYFILPTRSEAFGIAFVEANSYGLPAFGSDLGGVPDIIENGINGELIDIKKSPKELALQIHKYITESSYNEKSLRAFRHYQENFTWDKSIEKVNRILEELTTSEQE